MTLGLGVLYKAAMYMYNVCYKAAMTVHVPCMTDIALMKG